VLVRPVRGVIVIVVVVVAVAIADGWGSVTDADDRVERQGYDVPDDR
jgi:hypothetical protein